jgi:HK97 gp10 family phage protein
MAVDISITGDKELTRKLHSLADKQQKSVVRSALRKEAKKAKDRIVSNIERLDLIDEGVMLQAFKQAKIKSGGNRNMIRIGPENPERSALGIASDDKYYYPYAVEFGHIGAGPKPFIRPAIDQHKSKSIHDIGQDIGKGIERQARKK